MTAQLWSLSSHIKHSKLSNTSFYDTGISDALIARLHFRALFVQAIMPNDENDKTSPLQRWQQQRDLLLIIEQTAKPHTFPPCFSAKMHRKLATSVPPRPPVDLIFRDALATMQDMVDDLIASAGVLQFGHESSAACLKVRLTYYLFKSELM